MSATVMAKNGQPMEIGYAVDVKAEAGVGWESDEDPTGWNYKTDSPTYTSYTYATSGDVEVTSVTFVEDNFVIDNIDELSIATAQKYFDPAVLKQLLNPAIYAKVLGPLFDKAAENAEPPEQDYDEPERYDSRY